MMTRVRIGLQLLALLALTACSASSPGAPFWRPYYGPPPAVDTSDPGDPSGGGSIVPTGPTESADLAAPPVVVDDAGVASGPPPPCALAVSVTTVSPGGTYSPNNIGAIWIADGGGSFVKTLRVWADQRIAHLNHWALVTSQAGEPDNVTDAVTSASLTSHGTRLASWTCTNVAGHVVSDGNYQVCFELTDANSAGPYDCVAFSKGSMSVDLSPPDKPTFTKRRIAFTP